VPRKNISHSVAHGQVREPNDSRTHSSIAVKSGGAHRGNTVPELSFTPGLQGRPRPDRHHGVIRRHHRRAYIVAAVNVAQQIFK
jgi:hypothetical protein